jgi:hypothetical protein
MPSPSSSTASIAATALSHERAVTAILPREGVVKVQFYRIKSSNRICQLFPWLAPEGKPWSDKHERVVVQLTEEEQKHSKSSTKCHHLVVRRDNLEEVRERGLVL